MLKEKLKPEDKCWTTENYEIIENCEVCTKEETFGHKPLVCVARGERDFHDHFFKIIFIQETKKRFDVIPDSKHLELVVK